MDIYTILVTGGSGLLGRGLQYAVELDKMAKQKFRFVWLSSKDGDLRDREQVKQIFDKYRPCNVVHLAARVGGLYANMNDQIGFLRDNLLMNDNVISLCHEFGVKRAIFCLSTCVFPDKADFPLTEESIHQGPPNPSNEGYSHAKRILECLVRYYKAKYGYEWLCIIPTNMYGPHDNFHVADGHVLPALMHKCYLSEINKKPLAIFGSGTPLRQFLYSHDAGKIILQLLMCPKEKLNFSSIILCGEEEFSIKQVAETIIDAMGYCGEMAWDNEKSDGVYRKTASNARLMEFIGTEFKFTPLAAGVKETADWLKKKL